ncbi:MAG: hypothetical protein MZV64_30715 [Ignavibacteriales bacterium]|nr:hypothetical protein [Ignavibacteriales bacterium]
MAYSTCGIAAGAEDTLQGARGEQLAALPEAPELSAHRLRRHVLPGAAGRDQQRRRRPVSLRPRQPRQGGAPDRRARRQGRAGGRLAGLDERRQGDRHRLPRAPAPHRPPQLRQHRSGVDRRLHQGRRLPGAAEGARGEGPRRPGQHDDRVGAARPRRRRLPDRHEVAVHAPGCRAAKVHHLQRGRGRPGRVHGPLGAGERPALGHRRDDHRRLRDRRRPRLHLRPRRVPEGDRTAEHRDRAVPGARLPRATASSGARHRVPHQAEGGRRRVRVRRGNRADDVDRGEARHAARPARRSRPTKGLWEKPTSINNVETFANVPWIVMNGAKAFNSLGTAEQQGDEGLRDGREDPPRRPGRGADGHLDPRDRLRHLRRHPATTASSRRSRWAGRRAAASRPSCRTTVIDYESINKTGAIMGSGGLVVMDETTCMVDVARFFLEFTQRESCGKCTFCRVGTKRMLEVLTRITEGKGKDGDIELLEDLAAPRQELVALRPGPDRAQPGADDAEVLPVGVRGAHHQQEVPGAPLPEAADLHDHRRLQRLHAVREGLRGGRDHGRAQDRARHRPVEMHRLRRVLQGVQPRRACDHERLDRKAQPWRLVEARNRRQAGDGRRQPDDPRRSPASTASRRFPRSATMRSSSRSRPASSAW